MADDYQDDPSQVVEQPDFQTEFENKVREQFLGTTPEEIYKKKVAQYFQDMGVQPKGKVSRFAQIMKEASRAYQDSEQKKPYISAPERLRTEAQSEYERLAPGIRAEASTVSTNARTRAQNASRERIAQIKADEDKRKTEMTGNYQMRKAAAYANNQNAAADLVAQKISDLKKRDPAFEHYPKDIQSMTILRKIKEEEGEEAFQDAMKIMSQTADATAKPSAQKAMTGMGDEAFERYNTRNRELEAAKKLGKFAPVGGAGGTMRIMMMNKTDDNGNITQVPTYVNPRNPQAGFNEIKSSDNALSPNDAKIRSVSERFRASEMQARGAMGEMFAAVQTGKDKDFTSPGAGNPVAKTLRQWGLIGDKEAMESTSDVLLSNALALHTQGMMGGGTRYAYQALEDFKKRIANEHVASPRTLLYGMGALTYSIQLGQMQNSGKIKPDDVDNVLMTLINKEVDRSVNQAYTDRALHRQTPIKLASLSDIIQKAKALRGNPSASPKDSLMKDFNLTK